ncbi:MAG: hypothetical protein K2I10_08380 [Lachnospiraceae bacterium]|nr:hypothetical protein [Lachnospiraceae bacterium]
MNEVTEEMKKKAMERGWSPDDDTPAFKRAATVAFGMDGKTGIYEFVGRTEGILLGICRLHPYVEWYGTSEAGFVSKRIHEMDKTVKEAHFYTRTSL